MNDNIPEFIIERADDISALSDFTCGLKSMDAFIHDTEKGLNLYVKLGLTKLWIVRDSHTIIALFALSKGALRLSTSDRSTLEAQVISIEETIFDTKETYPSIEIDYLAVREGYRKKHIGSFIVNAIAQRAARDDLSATMFLTVEAIDTTEYSAVGFYYKCDFKDSEHGLVRNQNMLINGNRSCTKRMYRPLYQL